MKRESRTSFKYLVIALHLVSTVNMSRASNADAVFIETQSKKTTPPKKLGSQLDAHPTWVVTASDAAQAMNSVKFMDMLVGVKNAARVNTYTHTPEQVLPEGSILVAEGDEEKNSASWTPSFVQSFWRTGDAKVDVDDKGVAKSKIGIESLISTDACSRPSYVTTSEYTGRLWFLPDSTGGIKFRETIKVVSLAADGKSSTIECNTQYHNGKRWVDCSRIVCRFLSVSLLHDKDQDDRSSLQSQKRNNVQDDEQVEMSLDSELLVWLPLPGPASRAVQKKISSVFKTVATDFFEELASTRKF